MDLIVTFFVFFILAYILYYFFLIRKNKKYNPEKVPQEILFLTNKYKLDFDKINYRKLIKLLALTNSLIMAFTVLIVGFVDNFFIQILLAFLILFPLIYIVYSIIGKHYQKVGREK
ncbi:MAG: hypothetical protein WDA21_04865 [Bacilli bacterium]